MCLPSCVCVLHVHLICLPSCVYVLHVAAQCGYLISAHGLVAEKVLRYGEHGAVEGQGRSCGRSGGGERCARSSCVYDDGVVFEILLSQVPRLYLLKVPHRLDLSGSH